MLLAVAGLEESKVQTRLKDLTTGKWEQFTPAERVAFEFARKQAKTPWAITTADYRKLVDAFGPERALHVVWWACRCHYMTRVADAFQLPLERENVFRP